MGIKIGLARLILAADVIIELHCSVNCFFHTAFEFASFCNLPLTSFQREQSENDLLNNQQQTPNEGVLENPLVFNGKSTQQY